MHRSNSEIQKKLVFLYCADKLLKAHSNTLNKSVEKRKKTTKKKVLAVMPYRIIELLHFCCSFLQ